MVRHKINLFAIAADEQTHKEITPGQLLSVHIYNGQRSRGQLHRLGGAKGQPPGERNRH